MKKRMLILISVVTASAFAEIINCPTPDNYSVDEKSWDLSLSQDHLKVDVRWSAIPSLYLTHDFYKYNPITKKIEGFSGFFPKSYDIEVASLSFNVINNKITKNKKGTILQCMGTYSSLETYPSLIEGLWWRDQEEKGDFKAELLVNKNCVVVAYNKSFDCA